METLHCMIVDDEPMAIKVIESHLKEFNDIKLVASCRNATQAFDVLQNHKVDFIFLDIEMPKMDGLSFLKSLKDPPLVLITTAHRKFALDGFELDVLDYLLKPISLDRFMQAIAKIRRLRRLEGNRQGNNPGPTSHIYVKSDRENVKINLLDILYLESLKNHVKIVTPGKNYITMVSIGEMQNKLPSNLFLRVHRSYLVNIEHIQNYTNTYLVIDRKSFPLGNVYKQEVLEKLDKHRI
ncbi:LytTR family DNA-binding domain-containing protein [Muricauda sp. SCSIO 64092]|uniref:LytR/AlgR family response regulator transcription factor n=1 Tax=Allomuricauda sp. SCSIO 64092 TaxID=2908842 RepID=UPI001FF437D8|nr:LytTR family DNA-binding domain-containing protein [Muricauda sp. SCSIO 64092]UOY07141.1 LytTR family DNA-binding domain-containing protein [Muricauda sp. SCSIO 64092]